MSEFDIRSNLRQFLADLKEFEPALARDVRRRMRRSGDSAIAEMGRILDDYQGATDVRHPLGSAREEIKSGLRLRVTAGKTRTTVRLVSTRGAIAKPMNMREWRHPVFGREDTWAEQEGTGYFSLGAVSQSDDLKRELEAAIKVGLDALASRNPVVE
ncbi:hypothetical protein [Antribacter gilvus]|uniref:hypothetical protein n=1 Tax=Antribacter gilvus TaxID=2304675 RepID=UPI000F76B811|nr:hypothetical protein [Antribacter gilvus]